MIERVKNEIEIHCQLKHPNVVELYAYFEDDNYVYLILELCVSGELQRLLRDDKKPAEV